MGPMINPRMGRTNERLVGGEMLLDILTHYPDDKDLKCNETSRRRRCRDSGGDSTKAARPREIEEAESAHQQSKRDDADRQPTSNATSNGFADLKPRARTPYAIPPTAAAPKTTAVQLMGVDFDVAPAGADAGSVIASYSRIGIVGGLAAEPSSVNSGPTTIVPRGMIFTSLKMSTGDDWPIS